MRLTIERLRRALISGAILLIVVLGVYIGYGRYKAFLFYRNILKKNGISFTHDSSGITFSQSLQGKTVFTLRAARATPMGPGKWKLHDAELTLFGRVSQRADHISSSEIEWDEKEGVARALGQVHMDLQAPQALGRPASGAAAPHMDSPESIHVLTSGLVYLRKLGVAATDQPVEFRYAGIECTARGAEFNSGESTLHLLAEVVLDGQRNGHPVHLVAQRADLDRTLNVANLLQPVVTSEGRTARANTSQINFRTDGSLQHLVAQGNVILSRGTQRLTAAELQGAFNNQSVAQTAVLSGGVTLADANAQRPVEGAARKVDLLFTAAGAPSTLTAVGAAHLAMLDRRSFAAGLQRQMQGDRIVAHFLPAPHRTGSSQPVQLSEVDATGTPSARGESIDNSIHATPGKVPQLKTTQVAADDLRLLFAASPGSSPQPHQLFGSGHTRLEQTAPGNAQQTSSGDTLQIDFARTASSQLAIGSALQTGHVAVHTRAADVLNAKSPPATTAASADRAVFDGASERLTLAGSAHLSNLTSELRASTVTLDQRAQTADAAGDVEATLTNTGNGTSARPSPPTHILSASAHFEREGRIATFRGTDAAPARMWQQASQIQAANLLIDGDLRTFSARPQRPGTLIHAVFAANPGTIPATTIGKPRAPSASVVRVASPKMDYSDTGHIAVFAGTSPDSVQIDSTSGRALASRAVVFLTPANRVRPQPAVVPTQPNPLGSSLDRIVLSGGVQLQQPGRRGTGEQLTYTAATGDYILTGTPTQPPHIVDSQQGSLTGAELLFSDAGSTIVVTGAPQPASTSQSVTRSGRVHTETPVKPDSQP